MLSYTVVDAFAAEPLRGNPVGVFFDADDIPAERMQRIAREMNLSEVTFVLAPRAGGDARIRIFTPVNELPFAGHPLLGTAIALGGRTAGDRLVLETAMGAVPFELHRRGDTVHAAWMRQPVPRWQLFDRAGELLQALGLTASTVPVEIYHNGPRHVFVGLPGIEALAALDPDHRALAAFPDQATNCFAGVDGRWRNRMFSPAYGVVEDAATGSAAGPLAVHLARHGLITPGRRIEIEQGVEIGRSALMYATATWDEGRVSTVEVGGSGALFAHGTAYV